MSCSIWTPLISFAESMLEALPDWSVEAPTQSIDTIITLMAKANVFLPVTEMFLCFTIYIAINSALIIYRGGRSAYNAIRGCS